MQVDDPVKVPTDQAVHLVVGQSLTLGDAPVHAFLLFAEVFFQVQEFDDKAETVPWELYEVEGVFVLLSSRLSLLFYQFFLLGGNNSL